MRRRADEQYRAWYAAESGGSRAGDAQQASEVSERSTTPRRRSPALYSKVASLVLSVGATLGLAGLFARSEHSADTALDLGEGTVPTAGGTPTITVTPGTTVPGAVGSATTTPPITAVGGAIPDGTYTGGTFTNRWGPVQVAITYQGGSITAVDVLKYPDADRKSVMINERALPRYESETIAAQSADIASVTGATYTWRSYRQSLQSAIDAATAASQGS
ncbi:MAG: FMN-binding protein [Ilumatobacteraceae bacterium]